MRWREGIGGSEEVCVYVSVCVYVCVLEGGEKKFMLEKKLYQNCLNYKKNISSGWTNCQRTFSYIEQIIQNVNSPN